MSEIEKVQAQQTPELKEPWLKKFMPSWWVFQPKFKKLKKPFKQELCEWGGTLLVALGIYCICSAMDLVRYFLFRLLRVRKLSDRFARLLGEILDGLLGLFHISLR